MLHFIGFSGDEYNRALRVFGEPDFIHRYWDIRALQEFACGDTLVFAKDCVTDVPRKYSFDDSECF